MRDIFSSEYWLLGKSCLDNTDWGRIGGFAHSERNISKFNAWALNGSCENIFCQFGLGKTCSVAFIVKLSFEVYWEIGPGKKVRPKDPRLALEETPVLNVAHLHRSSWMSLDNMWGICIGKGLVNAYSVMVRPQFVFSPFVRK